MLQLRSSTLQATHAIAAAIAASVRSGDVIVLAGEMGAGKTAFAQGFGAALGVTDHMTSPTYNLVHSHPAGRITLHHADLYRLSTQHEVADLAFAELAEAGGVLLVEWGDVVANSFGEHLLVELTVDPSDDGPDDGSGADSAGDGAGDGDAARLITVTGVGRTWAARWAQLERDLAAFAC